MGNSMKIAYLNPWRNAAENQAFESLRVAARRIGHELVHCANSIEVHACTPDFVLACSSFQPKLNDTPHYAVVHAHRELYVTERTHYDNLLTCDGYLTISDSLARFIRDLTFAAAGSQEAGFYFNTCQRLDIRADLHTLIASSRLKITYCGAHCDTRRAALIALLARHEGVEVFGPEQSWAGLDRKAYGGMLPFDGVSVQKKYAENGIGLCLLSDGHYRDDVISNCIFEIASVGAIAICPDIPWLRRNFGDSLYYIDQSLPHPYLARQILLRREEICRDPAAAIEKASRAREIFERHFAAEVLLENAVAYHHRVSTERQATLTRAAQHAPLISVIVRCGSRPLDVVRRAVESIASQSYGRFDVILVRHSAMDLSPLTSLTFPNIETIRVIDSPAGKRSTSLWAGLAAVKGQYFSVLDDDDWYFSNHFETLFHPIASPPPDRFFAYSGAIVAQPDASPIPGGGSDNRHLAIFGIASSDDLFSISRAFVSNCFVASSNLLHPALLDDPQLVTCEDSYLILSLQAQIDPRFSYAATAVYERGRAGQSDFARHPLRFEDELTVQLRLHTRFAALSEFWKRRPAAKEPQIPAELIETIATGFNPKTSAIRPGCRVLNPETGECRVDTAPEPWAYSAEFSIDIPAGREGPGFVRLEVLVASGPIGIGVLNPAGTDFLLRVPVKESEEPQSIHLPVADFRQMGRLVIQNWDTPGVHSARIGSLTLWGMV